MSTWIIIRREYFERLKSRGFILATILGPLALLAAIAIPIATVVFLEDDSKRTLHIQNSAGLALENLQLSGAVDVVISDLPEEDLKDQLRDRSISAYLLLPHGIVEADSSAKFVSRGSGGLQFRFELQHAVEELVRQERLRAAGVADSVQSIMRSAVGFEGVRLTEEGEATDTSSLLAVVGYVMALVIYICVFLYGSLVMRSVIEEKTSRIVEVIVSSVRPFELMLGKVVGVGALGLTQLLIWFATLAVVLTVGAGLVSDLAVTTAGQAADGVAAPPEMDLSQLNIPTIPAGFFVYFLLFFLGGYLLYASLFATVGSVVEQESDAQQFMIPVAIPIVLSLLLLGRIIDSPDSSLSVIASHIPFFSPVLMPVRIVVSHLPWWEVPLALTLLFATFAGTVWVCSRIYRVGILMYGKKPGISDIAKWVRMP